MAVELNDTAPATSTAPMSSVSLFGTPAVLLNKAEARHSLADIVEDGPTDKGSSWLDSFQ